MQDYIPLSGQKSGALDINATLKSFEIKQYDNNSRKIYISLRDIDNPNEQTVNLENHTVRAYFKLPDGGMEYVDGEVIDSDEGVLAVTIPSSVTRQVGVVECEIGISCVDDGSFISLRVLRFTVIPSIRDDSAIEATEQFSALENALRKVDGLDSTITAIKNIVTPEMSGAKGDGTTDDSTAFEYAIRAGGTVRCTSGKTYYFASPVDIRDLTEASIDMNGSVFKNFQIYININDDLTDWRIQYRINGLRISNGYIGGVIGSDNDWLARSQNWNQYCIYAGGNVTLENVIFVNHLAVLARPARYNDYLSFTDVSLWKNDDLFADLDTDFDAVAEIQSDGSITRITSGQGDGWIFKACHGWHANDDFALITFRGNFGVTLINCIQSRFYINQFSSVTAIGCHFEKCFPEVVDLYFDTVNFVGCYFYAGQKIIDHPGVTYDGCIFRALGYDRSPNALNVYDFLGGKNIHELSCRINNSFFGDEIYVNTDECKRIYNAPKKTFHWEREYISFDCTPSESSVETAVFEETGTYTYDFHLLPTNSETEANRAKTVTVDKTSLKTPVIFADMHCLVGGWGILVYRTSPSGAIHKTCIWTDTNYGDAGNVDVIRDYGDYFRLFDDGAGFFSVWKSVDSKPDIAVNDKLFGVGYAYITTDNSAVSNSDGGVQIATN